MAQPQEEGYYPRLNATLLRSGIDRYRNSIVSLVGTFDTTTDPQAGTVNFVCADRQVVKVSTEHAEVPVNAQAHQQPPPVYEIVGQVVDADTVVVSSLLLVIVCLLQLPSVLIFSFRYLIINLHLGPLFLGFYNNIDVRHARNEQRYRPRRVQQAPRRRAESYVYYCFIVIILL